MDMIGSSRAHPEHDKLNNTLSETRDVLRCLDFLSESSVLKKMQFPESIGQGFFKKRRL